MNCPSCNAPVEPGQPTCPACGAHLPDAPDPLIGLTLGGKFKVVSRLGEGGMGAVYQGEQQLGTSKRRVAVKTLHPEYSRDQKIKDRFTRECGTLAELEHPHTIQVYDFGTTPDGQLYIVMEFVQGTNVGDILLREGPMSPERVASVMTQVCGSLEEAHGRGIVHRDLKPDNVVLTERAGQKDFVKLLDFGIAKRGGEADKNEQKLTQQGMVLGTPPYMSPEQFTGRPIDARSDIYSLGAMSYEMLTGTLPFHGETAWEWATQHMTVPPTPIEATPRGAAAPEGMRRAIMKALAKVPEERFANVKEFISAFTSGGARGGTAVMTPGVAGPPSHVTIHTTPGEIVSVRGQTLAGESLEYPPGFTPPTPGGVPGGGAAAGGPAGGYGGPVVGATPAGGNVAFPTPPGIPPGPVAAQPAKGRGALIAALGVLGVGSVVAIVVGVTLNKKPKSVNFDADSGAVALAVDAGTGAAAGDRDAGAEQQGDELVQLADAGHVVVHPVHDGGAVVVVAHDAGKPVGPEPPSCNEARTLRKAANPEWQKLAADCFAKTGHMP
jgi:tRNA A-37 threonylcarbamoyl transferase component Bud32